MNRTEPDRATMCPKTQAEQRRTEQFIFRTETNRILFEKSRTEPNRTVWNRCLDSCLDILLVLREAHLAEELQHLHAGRNKKPNRTGRTEPSHVISEPNVTGRGNEPNRTGPSHDASNKCWPNRVETGGLFHDVSNKHDRTQHNSLFAVVLIIMFVV